MASNWIVPGVTFVVTYTDLFAGLAAGLTGDSFMLLRPINAFIGGALGYSGLYLAGDVTKYEWNMVARIGGYAAVGALVTEVGYNAIFGGGNAIITSIVAAMFANYGYNGQWWPSGS